MDDWKARCFADKTIKKAVQDEIKTLALVVLGNNELKIEHDPDGYDSYPLCKSWEKSYCPARKNRKKYCGKFRDYVVFGETKIDVYLEVLRCLANDQSLYIPIVAWKRAGDSHE